MCGTALPKAASRRARVNNGYLWQSPGVAIIALALHGIQNLVVETLKPIPPQPDYGAVMHALGGHPHGDRCEGFPTSAAVGVVAKFALGVSKASCLPNGGRSGAGSLGQSSVFPVFKESKTIRGRTLEIFEVSKPRGRNVSR